MENLILHTLGELDEPAYERIRLIEPRLRQVFRDEGSWIDILKKQLELPANFEDQVRTAWASETQRAQAAGQTLDPVAFARAVADRVVGREDI